MKWETAKSLILVVLIGMSLVLTFGMWNYQPERDSIDEHSAEEVSLGGTEETRRSLIRPSDIIFKADGSYYGFKNPADRGQLYDNMQSWILEDVETQNGGERVNRNNEIEVIFPDAFPLDLLSSIFSSFSEDDVTLPGWSFERFYITFNSETKSIRLEIPSFDGREKLTAMVNNPTQYDRLLTHLSNLNSEDYRTYTVMDEGAHNIYLPADETVLPRKTMKLTTINGSQMVEALFPTTTVVSNSTTPGGGVTYFSDSRQLAIGPDKLSMEYVNPYKENTVSLTAVNLLDRSRSNINDHSGWTSDFVLIGLHERQGRVEYRMYHQGFPVFNNANPDLALIEQIWNSEQLEEYRRPLFKLDNFPEETNVTLESGTSLLDKLNNKSDIEEITIGYQLTVEQNEYAQPYVTMEPAWYVKRDGVWKLPVDDNDEAPQNLEGGD